MAAKADGAFATESSVKKSAQFVCARGSQKLANLYKIKGAPVVLFVDPDGEELHRASFTDESALSRAMEAALGKYQNKPVSWKSEVGSSGSRKLLVVGFDDEAADGLKVLEDKMLVKFHDRCDFVKLPSQKDGEAAKKWGVTSFPAIILCDASQENPEKAPFEKLVGKKTPGSVKVAIQKALAKLETKK